jgi:uncharacterized protein YqjF (DUF2071 family)
VLRRLADSGEWALSRVARGARVLGQSRATREIAHRPWPLPDGPWIMGQTWEQLLFAHWPVDPALLRRAVPMQIPIDTFGEIAWIGVTPFEVRALRLHGSPPLPAGSRFPELNVRTYTTIGGRPGIYFFSLDAGSRLAVAAARRAYRLPYFHARMAIRRDGEAVSYRSRRVDSAGPGAELSLVYRPTGEPFNPAPGSLEHFVTERYCLYTLDERRRVLRAEIHHPPWPLRAAEADFSRNTMTEPLGIALPGPPTLLHFSARQDVVIWPLAIAADDAA